MASRRATARFAAQPDSGHARRVHLAHSRLRAAPARRSDIVMLAIRTVQCAEPILSQRLGPALKDVWRIGILRT